MFHRKQGNHTRMVLIQVRSAHGCEDVAFTPTGGLTLICSLKEEVVGRKVRGVAPVLNDVPKDLLWSAVVH